MIRVVVVIRLEWRVDPELWDSHTKALSELGGGDHELGVYYYYGLFGSPPLSGRRDFMTNGYGLIQGL